MTSKFIPEELFIDAINNFPILCVDILVSYQGKYVLIKRNEEPMKDVYWVIGGRVNRNETLKNAVKRKLSEELAPLDAFDIHTLRMIGTYEDQYDEHRSDKLEGKYHTVAIVFEIELLDTAKILLDKTATDWGLFKFPPERFNPRRWYFEDVFDIEADSMGEKLPMEAVEHLKAMHSQIVPNDFGVDRDDWVKVNEDNELWIRLV